MAFQDPGTNRTVLWSLGPIAPTVTVEQDVKAGDVLGYSSGWVKAIASGETVIQGRLVAVADAPADGQCPVSHVALVEGYSGATAGGYVYVSTSAAGSVTQTAPSSAGDADTIIGIALTETTILFFLNSRPDSTVPAQ